MARMSQFDHALNVLLILDRHMCPRALNYSRHTAVVVSIAMSNMRHHEQSHTLDRGSRTLRSYHRHGQQY